MRLRFWQRERDVDPAPRDRRTEDEKLLDWLAELPEGEARAIRTEAGWTQTEVADHLGVVPSHVSRWERGTARWSPFTGVKYARLLRELSLLRDREIEAVL